MAAAIISSRSCRYLFILIGFITKMVLIQYSAAAFQAVSVAEAADDDNISNSMFVFGDSQYDIGNVQYYHPGVYNPSNHYPYGMAYFPIPTGRQSDGLLIPDVLSMYAGANLPLPYLNPDASFTYGANFAYQGACILAANNPTAMNLPQQLEGFFTVTANWTSKLGTDEALEALNKSVVVIALGGVDYFYFNDLYSNSTETEQQDYVELVVETLVSAIKEMYNVGARKFALQNVGPLGCMPDQKVGNTCKELPLKLAKMHNIALPTALKELEEELEGFKYGIFDFYNALLDIIDNPTTYGFVEADIGCCGTKLNECGTEPYVICTNPSAYAFFDYGHATQRANIILANWFWNGDQNMTAPYSIKQLYGVQQFVSSNFRLMAW